MAQVGTFLSRIKILVMVWKILTQKWVDFG